MYPWAAVYVAARHVLQSPSSFEDAGQCDVNDITAKADLIACLVNPLIKLGFGQTITNAVIFSNERLLLRATNTAPETHTAKLLRNDDLNRATSLALSHGDLQLAKQLVAALRGEWVTTAISTAAKLGYLGFLQWLKINHPSSCWGGREMTKAARYGQLQVLQWLHENTSPFEDKPLLGFAARHENADIIGWVLPTRGESIEAEDVTISAEHGRLNNLKYLYERLDTPLQIDTTRVARQGHVDVLAWLSGGRGVFSRETMDRAAECGHLDVIYWLHNHRHEGCTRRAVDLAARNGHFDVVKWLTAHNVHSAAAIRMAIRGGHATIARWLFTNVPIQWEGGVVDQAATHSTKETVAWLDREFPFDKTTDAMDNAARGDNEEVFRWLHFDGAGDCTTSAMDYFAMRGNIGMLAWLSENRREGCTSAAMDGAAAAGRLDVVVWLHENRREGCTVSAMDRAAGNGHLAVVQWLTANRSEGCTTAAMDDAAGHGHYAVVKWLHNNRHEGATERAMDLAAGHGHFDILVFLHDERTEGCSRTGSRWAADHGHLEILQWLISSYPTRIDAVAVRLAAQVHGWPPTLLHQLADSEPV